MAGRDDPKSVARRIIPTLDLTNLDDSCDEAAIEKLCAKARTPFGPVAAVCIWPRFVKLARQRLAQSGVRIATVTNFPSGAADVETAAGETAAAVADGADEVDVVFPYAAFSAGDRAIGGKLVRACRDACRRSTGGRALLKVILETGRLGTAAVIREAAAIAIASGADFVKTSTGKLDPGATIPAAAAMLDAIAAARAERRWVGLKVSGGVRTVAEAAGYIALAEARLGAEYINPGTFRIGASRLLDDALAALGLG
jgi:deoxyribose-phosphate aldolase